MIEMDQKTAYSELAYYTFAHENPNYFIHQHIVDAFTAQLANENTKPIAIIFALVGLFLFVEKGYGTY
jgi:regulation of enolase protein 1 (concanavalin A-like superfamily)